MDPRVTSAPEGRPMVASDPASPLFATPNPRLLLIAATGGHLTQLVRFAEREGAAADSLWITFRNAQSESLLARKRVHFVEYVAPRDVRATIATYRTLSRTYDPTEFDGALSTGPAVGVAGLAWATRHRIPSVYIESVSRTDKPSLSGSLVSRLRLGRTLTQHPSWASQRWQLTDSVMTQYAQSARTPHRAMRDPLKIFVTLGTIRPYRFDRLVDRVTALLHPEDEVVWQLGETSRTGLPGTVHTEMPNSDLLAAALHADTVITHSGVGTILQLLDAGICPVIVPRSVAHHEHVDNHQHLIWEHLQQQSLGVTATVDTLDRDALYRAAHTRVTSKGTLA